ncbi:hypothetical protein [Aurantivibrio plasticivorans]
MTTEVIYENDGEGIYYIHRDVLQGAWLVEKMKLHNRQIDFRKLRYQIVDFRHLDRLELTTEQLQQVADIDRSIAHLKRPDFQLAIILASDSMSGITHMWEVYVNMPENNAKFFYSLEEAREWLGQKQSEVKQVKVM